MKANIFLALFLLVSTITYAHKTLENEIREDGDTTYNTSAFVTTWKTTTDNESINIYTNYFITSAYDYTIHWGDGVIETNLTTDASHQYATAGTYMVQITGDFPAIWTNREYDNGSDHLQSIDNWGTIAWESMESAFAYCQNLVYRATDTPNLNNVKNMNAMFVSAVVFEGDLSNWDVSNVTTMTRMFTGAVCFNQNIGNWDVSNVTNMESLFYQAKVFNQDISKWDVSKVTNMHSMFGQARSFNKDISSWDVSNVNDMSFMFTSADSFNQDLSAWDVSNVTQISGMFQEAKGFSQDLSDWSTIKVNSCEGFSTLSGLKETQRPRKGICFLLVNIFGL